MIYVCGKFELNKKSRQLRFDGLPVGVSQRGIDILIYLIEQNGLVAAKKNIYEAVWPGQLTSDANLTKQISLLRRSLAELAPGCSIIVTVPGIGYRVERWESYAAPEPGGEITAPPGEEVIEPPTEAAPPPPEMKTTARVLARQRPRRWTVLARRSIVILMLIGLCTYLYLIILTRIEGGYQLGPSSIVLARASAGFKRNLIFSRDGKSLAYYQSEEPEGAGQLFILNRQEDRTTRLPVGLATGEEVAWSPDSQSLALLGAPLPDNPKYPLMISSVDGKEVKTIGEVEPGGLDWSPDGREIAVCDRPNGTSPGSDDRRVIQLLSSRDYGRRQLTIPTSDGSSIDTHPRFSPDGSRVAFLRRTRGNGEEIFVVRIDTGQLRQLTADEGSILDLDWAPGGDEILFISNRSHGYHLWRVSAQPASVPSRPTPPTRVTSIKDQLRSFSISDHGEVAYTCQSGDKSQIDLIPLIAEPLTSLTQWMKDRHRIPCTLNANSATHSPVFSPDGRQLAFASNLSGTEELWIANSDCLNNRQVTFLNLHGLTGLDWSPDGARIAFSQWVNGQADIFYFDLATSRVHRLTTTPEVELQPRWSHDSAAIYFSTRQGEKGAGGEQIWRLLIDQQKSTPLILDSEGEYAEHPDQSRLYFTRRGQIWQKSLRSGREVPLPASPHFPLSGRWQLINGDIMLTGPMSQGRPANKEDSSLLRLDPQSGKTSRVINLDAILPGTRQGIILSPDSRTLARPLNGTGAREIRFVLALDQP